MGNETKNKTSSKTSKRLLTLKNGGRSWLHFRKHEKLNADDLQWLSDIFAQYYDNEDRPTPKLQVTGKREVTVSWAKDDIELQLVINLKKRTATKILHTVQIEVREDILEESPKEVVEATAGICPQVTINRTVLETAAVDLNTSEAWAWISTW